MLNQGSMDWAFRQGLQPFGTDISTGETADRPEFRAGSEITGLARRTSQKRENGAEVDRRPNRKGIRE